MGTTDRKIKGMVDFGNLEGYISNLIKDLNTAITTLAKYKNKKVFDVAIGVVNGFYNEVNPEIDRLFKSISDLPIPEAKKFASRLTLHEHPHVRTTACVILLFLEVMQKKQRKY